MTRRIAAALTGTLMASGCLVARVELAVDANGLVDGTASIAYRTAFLEASGTSPADAQQALLTDLTDDGVDGLDCLPFRDAETIGASCTLTDVRAEELSQLDVFDRRIAIARVDERIVVDAVVDLTEFEPNPTNDLDATMTVTFAGPIVEQSEGSVDGTTVSWMPRLGERLDARAVAEVGPRDAPPVVAIAVAAVIAVVMAGAGAFVLGRRR